MNANDARQALSNTWVSNIPDTFDRRPNAIEMFKMNNRIFLFAGDLEQQFTILREQLYHERIKQIETHLSDVRNGRSQEYLEPLKRLTDNMQNRIEVAGVLKRLRLENINHKFLAEEQGANQHFEVSFTHSCSTCAH